MPAISAARTPAGAGAARRNAALLPPPGRHTPAPTPQTAPGRGGVAQQAGGRGVPPGLAARGWRAGRPRSPSRPPARQPGAGGADLPDRHQQLKRSGAAAGAAPPTGTTLRSAAPCRSERPSMVSSVRYEYKPDIAVAAGNEVLAGRGLATLTPDS